MSKLWTATEVLDRSRGVTLAAQSPSVIRWVDGASAVKVNEEERCWLVKRVDGKALKSPSFLQPNIEEILNEQH